MIEVSNNETASGICCFLNGTWFSQNHSLDKFIEQKKRKVTMIILPFLLSTTAAVDHKLAWPNIWQGSPPIWNAVWDAFHSDLALADVSFEAAHELCSIFFQKGFYQ